jgi:mRNA-degrading endonuclease RelE of RelBE toxin-antitoxin system
MKQILILPSFERSIKKLTVQEKKLLSKSLEQFNSFLISVQVPAGFGFKKINHDKYEFRVDIRLRVVVKVDGGDYYLVLVGNHEDIRRYLKSV